MWDFPSVFSSSRAKSWPVLSSSRRPASAPCRDVCLISSFFSSPPFLEMYAALTGKCLQYVGDNAYPRNAGLAKWPCTACCCTWPDNQQISFLPCTLEERVLLFSAHYIPQHEMSWDAVFTLAVWWASSVLPCLQKAPWGVGAGCSDGPEGTWVSQEWKAALFLPWGTNLISFCEAEWKTGV